MSIDTLSVFGVSRLVIASVFASAVAGVSAQPTVATPLFRDQGAGQATLVFSSSAAGTGYFTLLEGGARSGCTAAQCKLGKDGSNAAAARFGALRLSANVPGAYTIRGLKAGTVYGVYFTADADDAYLAAVQAAEFSTTTSANLTSADWVAVGSRGFSSGQASTPSLAFSPSGELYAAFSGTASGGGNATVMRFDGDAWRLVGAEGFSPGSAYGLILRFSPSGIPFVVYSDGANGSRPTVMRFDGSSWTTVGGAGFAPSNNYNLGLEFGPDGQLYVAFLDSTFSPARATVMRFDGSTWQVVGSAGFSANSAGYPSFLFSADGLPMVSYADPVATAQGPGTRVTVMKWDGAAWGTVGPAAFSRGYDASYTSLAVGPDGVPFVAFRNWAVGVNANACVMRFNGATWDIVGQEAVSAGAAFNTSVAVAPDGVPYVAFSDDGAGSRAAVMRLSGSSWIRAGRSDLSAGYGLRTKLAISPEGIPHVIFEDYANGHRATVMRLVPDPRATFADWVAANFSLADQGTAAITGATADPDGAGVTNLMRYALDLPARGPVGSPVSLVTVSEGGQQYLQLEFARRTDSPGLRYEVQASPDLASWTTVSTWYSAQPRAVVARDPVALGSDHRRFMRLRVLLP